MCWRSNWHLYSLAFYFQSFGNAQKFPVSQNWSKPLCVAVLPMSLAFFLSGPSNQCINSGFVGAKTPQMAQPLSTCWQFCISLHICVLWMGLAPAVCLNLCWGEVGRQVTVFWNETYRLGSFTLFLGVPKAFGCQRRWAPKSLGYFWNCL